VDADIFRDLKQLDERLQTVDHLLELCAELFEKNYSEVTPENKGTFSWPYAIEGTSVALPGWGNYAEKFPDTPKLSPSTSALCGWAISRLSGLGNKDQKEGRQKAVSGAAAKLASLDPSRLDSQTWKDIGEIFLHAQVLRFLASQNQFRGVLFEFVYDKVNETIKDPGNQHPFFLHYCVLAWEEVRSPALKVAQSVLDICDLSDSLTKLQARATELDSLTLAIRSLELASDLRDTLISFATVVSVTLPQQASGKRLDELAAETKDVIVTITSTIKEKDYRTTNDTLSSLTKNLADSLKEAGGVLAALPSALTEGQLSSTTSKDLRKAAVSIKDRPWYGEAFRKRLDTEVVRQISYASSSEESRLDIGALAYSLAAIFHCDSSQLPIPLARKALLIIFEHQRGGRWSEVQPVASARVGLVHFPLNLEIGNAVLSILMRDLDSSFDVSWLHIDEIMDWVQGTVNKVGQYRGWATEHDYSPDRIDLWVTAQVAQFLLDYKEVRSRLVLRSAIDRAGIVTTSGSSVSTSWKKLLPPDLEKGQDKQIKNRFRDKFVTPNERAETPRHSSVLLYGPPGTSKTSLMEALANRLGWQFLQITPADFLSTGGEQVEARATLLFEILKRGKNLVILFDEVDELLLDREAIARPEGIFRFMTTSMLPKLQSLKSRGNVIFGIATNYKERLDRAITRQGRVDVDWEVLPPDFTSRIVLIRKFEKSIDEEKARALAANTPFFSFLELKRVVPVSANIANHDLSKDEFDPWEIVKHPTASPEAYSNRPGADEEFGSLLDSQITEWVVRLAGPTTRTVGSATETVGPETKNILAKQLRTLETRKDLFEKDTVQEIQAGIKRLDGTDLFHGFYPFIRRFLGQKAN
jgi:hypothetical protein